MSTSEQSNVDPTDGEPSNGLEKGNFNFGLILSFIIFNTVTLNFQKLLAVIQTTKSFKKTNVVMMRTVIQLVPFKRCWRKVQ